MKSVGGISIIILTHNEELHVERCINSLVSVANKIFVVDSFSTDRTVEICRSLGAKVYQRTWKNYADQFQWGLDNCPIETDWVMRMDADEYIEADLIDEIPVTLADAGPNCTGFYVCRKYFFLGKWIKNGGVYPLNLLRIWRVGKGRIERRWMDEHIVLEGGSMTVQLKGCIVDDNLNNTRWWTDKHNKYADREMVDILNKKYNLFDSDDALKEDSISSQAKVKRMIKERLYNKLPVFVRPFIYFLYRYFILLGFLDGITGFAFHFFQGYWYRSLVDLRVYEAERILSGATDNKERIARLEKLVDLKLQ